MKSRGTLHMVKNVSFVLIFGWTAHIEIKVRKHFKSHIISRTDFRRS